MSSFVGPKSDAKDFWLRLDNAAKIFPSGTNKKRTLVFRFTAEICKPVNFGILQEATRLTATRYPYFTMHLRRGFFWYWLDSENPELTIVQDTGLPCQAFHFSGKEMPLCRILTRTDQISAEFYHVLADGYGAMEFFKTLLTAYAELSGYALPDKGFSHYSESSHEEETEDAYNHYFDPKLPAPLQLSRAYHIPYPVLRSELRIIPLEVNSELVRQKAKSLGISLTEYLASIYLWSLQEIYNRTRHIRRLVRRPVIRVQVPVNLRSLFPTRSLRNFSLFVTPEIDMRLGQYTFEEITRIVHYYMQHQTDPKLMRKRIYKNVRNEKSLFIKLVPLVIKNRILNYYFKRSGMALYSGLITNLGRIELKGDMEILVQRLRLIPPPPDLSKVSIGAITWDQKLVLSFVNSTPSNLLEKIFLDYLVQDGIPVKIIKP